MRPDRARCSACSGNRLEADDMKRALLAAALLAAFFCLYPKRLFVNRWLWAGFWAGPIVATVYGLYLFGRTVYDPQHLTALAPPRVLVVIGIQSLAYLAAVLVVLPVTMIFEPWPMRVRNIFICGTVVFWPSSRMMTAWFRVLPRMYASGTISMMSFSM